MTNKKIKLLLPLLLLVSFSFSQVAGYMGKRMIINYSANFFPSAIGPTVNNTNIDYTGKIKDGPPSLLGVNLSSSVGFDYIYKYRQMVSTELQYVRTGVDYHTNINGVYYNGNLNQPAVLNSFAVGLGAKLFRRIMLAPLGWYTKWEGLVYINQVKYNNDYYRIDDQGNHAKMTSGLSGDVNFVCVGFSFSFGKHRIFNDRIVLDYGLKLIVIPQALFALASQGDANDVESRFENDAMIRIARHQLINLHCSIGFLAH